MNQTQKNCITFWAELLLTVTVGISLLVGICLNQLWAFIISAILLAAGLGYVVAIWIAERVYLWRIMGILTPREWEVAKWYRFSLLSGGPTDIIDSLAQESEPNEWHISIFQRINDEVEIPKILRENS